VKHETKTRIASWALIALASMVLSLAMNASIGYAKKSRLETRFSSLAERADARLDEEEVIAKKLGPAHSAEGLIEYFNEADTIYNVFAALYDSDYNLLTSRHPDVTVDRVVFFEPLSYEWVIDAMESSDSGVLAVGFAIARRDGREDSYTTPLYFRKISAGGERLTAALAIPLIYDTVELPASFYLTIYAIFAVAAFGAAYGVFSFAQYLDNRFLGSIIGSFGGQPPEKG